MKGNLEPSKINHLFKMGTVALIPAETGYACSDVSGR